MPVSRSYRRLVFVPILLLILMTIILATILRESDTQPISISVNLTMNNNATKFVTSSPAIRNENQFLHKLTDAKFAVMHNSSHDPFGTCHKGRNIILVLPTKRHGTHRDSTVVLDFMQRADQLLPSSKTVIWNQSEKSSMLFQFHRPVSNNCKHLASKSIATDAVCEQYINTSAANSGEDIPRTWTYIRVLPNAVVNGDGDVISGEVKLVSDRCGIKSAGSKCFSAAKKTQVYDEVFTISQYWGAGFFHGTLENLPRLAPFLHHLHQVSSISLLNLFWTHHANNYTNNIQVFLKI